MSDDMRAALRAAYEAAEEEERRIQALPSRLLTDPVAHAVSRIVRKALDHDAGRERTILVATAAILALFDSRLAELDELVAERKALVEASSWPNRAAEETK